MLPSFTGYMPLWVRHTLMVVLISGSVEATQGLEILSKMVSTSFTEALWDPFDVIKVIWIAGKVLTKAPDIPSRRGFSDVQ